MIYNQIKTINENLANTGNNQVSIQINIISDKILIKGKSNQVLP